MANRLTKIASIALVTLSAAAPMAMASTNGTAVIPGKAPVSVVPLGPQPDQPYLQTIAANGGHAMDAVRVAALGMQPRMTFAQQAADATVRGSAIVTEGTPSAAEMIPH